MTLVVSNLGVRFSGFELGPVDIQLSEGRVLALLGTNGSGKSTLIRSILGLQDITSGTIHWQHGSLRPRTDHAFARIGYVSDSSRDLLGEFTALEYWRYCLPAFERARGSTIPHAMDAAVRYAEILDFPHEQRVPLAGLSLGTSRKAQIIAALMMSPRLLILDEPFIGLDFISARALESVLRRLRAGGTTIVVSNHDLDLASRLADSIVLLHRGRILINASVASLGGHSQLEPAVVAALRRASVNGASANSVNGVRKGSASVAARP